MGDLRLTWINNAISCKEFRRPTASLGAFNGGRNLELLREHLANDDLVAWCWNPATARDAVPGTQTALGELIRAWIDTGAECP